MLHQTLSEIPALRADMAVLRILSAAIRLEYLLRKANFNPAQLRIPTGEPGGGQWTSDDGGSTQLAADKPAPLRRLHPDSTYERDRLAKNSLNYWRQQSTNKIIESLKPGKDEPLTVRPDGTIWQGNTRIRVLQERGYDVNTLPRVPYGINPPRGGRGGGGRRFPRML